LNGRVAAIITILKKRGFEVSLSRRWEKMLAPNIPRLDPRTFYTREVGSGEGKIFEIFNRT
jgi:hypothetical protein